MRLCQGIHVIFLLHHPPRWSFLGPDLNKKCRKAPCIAACMPVEATEPKNTNGWRWQCLCVVHYHCRFHDQATQFYIMLLGVLCWFLICAFVVLLVLDLFVHVAPAGAPA